MAVSDTPGLAAATPRARTPARGRTSQDVLVSACIAGLALGLRLIGLDRKSVWFDEVITYVQATTPWPDVLDAMRHDVHPPLGYVVFHLWPWLQSGDAWLRLPAALLGAAAAPVAFAWARRIASPAEAVLTGVFVAVAPLQVDLAQEARMYGLLLLLVSASLYLLDRLLVRPTWPGAVAYTSVATACLYTHYYGGLFLAAEGLALALTSRRSATPGARPALACLAVAGLLFVPWLPVLAQQAGGIQGDYWIEPPRATTLWVTFRDLAAHTPPDEPFHLILRVAYVVQAGLVGLGAGLAAREARQRVAVALLGLPIGGALAISVLVEPIYATRYVSPVGVAFGFLLARGLAAVGRRLLRPSARPAGRAGALTPRRPADLSTAAASRTPSRAPAAPADRPADATRARGRARRRRRTGVRALTATHPALATRGRELALSRGGLSARTIGRLVTLTLGLLAGLPVLLSLASLYTDPGYGRADLRAAAQFVTHQRQPDEIVLHLGAFTQAPFDYYGVASPSRVLETNQRSELCGAIHGTPGGWLVTAYAADDDQARDAAEAGITDPGYAGGLVHQAPYRVLGASVFHLVGDCAFYP